MHAAERKYQHEGHHHHGIGRGPSIYYGYCPERGRMRMMDYSEYTESIREIYGNMYSAMTRSMRPWIDLYMGREWRERREREEEEKCREHHEREECHERREREECHEREEECGCREDEDDCHCSCCIRDADAVAYVHCSEVRIIPITLDNDTRRERDVKLTLGEFATASGKSVGWDAQLSEQEFKLLPCGEKTVFVKVTVDCSKLGGGDAANERQPSVDECKVAYATLRAEGCLIRPLMIAVAVRPNDCGAHRTGCRCGCC